MLYFNNFATVYKRDAESYKSSIASYKYRLISFNYAGMLQNRTIRIYTYIYAFICMFIYTRMSVLSPKREAGSTSKSRSLHFLYSEIYFKYVLLPKREGLSTALLELLWALITTI